MNDRELSENIGIKMSTITSIKNRLRASGVFRKANIPAYQRFGYSVVSLSSTRARTALSPAFDKGPAGSTAIFGVQDPLGALVMAYHKGFHEFKTFEAAVDGWDHQLFSLAGARRIVEFDFTNSVNKAFFGNRFDAGEGMSANEGFYDLRKKVERSLLGPLIRMPDANSLKITKATGVSRQTVYKIRERFRKKGLINRTTLVDPRVLGLGLISAVVLELKDGRKGAIPDRTARDIERIARPVWFQAFRGTCVLLACHVDYDGFARETDLLRKLKEVARLNAQIFGLKDGDLRYRFELTD